MFGGPCGQAGPVEAQACGVQVVAWVEHLAAFGAGPDGPVGRVTVAAEGAFEVGEVAVHFHEVKGVLRASIMGLSSVTVQA